AFADALPECGHKTCSVGGRRAAEEPDYRHRRLLRARSERPCCRTAEQRDELAASHCPMPPVLPTERIAHLATPDSSIHPPGRNEMIAITPPKIFSKEVAPLPGVKRAVTNC